MKQVLFTSLFVFLFFNSSFAQLVPNFQEYCNEITQSRNEEDGSIKYQTPFEYVVSFRKVGSSVFMTVKAVGRDDKPGKGVIIDFERGFNITKNVPTRVYIDEKGQWIHYLEFKLSKDELALVKNYNMVSLRVGNYNAIMDNFLRFKAYAYCLSKV